MATARTKPAKKPAKKPQIKTPEHLAKYTSVYLSGEARTKLAAMSDDTGVSRSKIVDGLILGANADVHAELVRIAEELSALAGV